MQLTEYDDQLAYALEKVRTLEVILMGIVMEDRNPAGLRKSVEKLISGLDGTGLYYNVPDSELEMYRRARADTVAIVFGGVPPESTPKD